MLGPSTFKVTPLADFIKARFPTVSGFEIDYFCESVQPVKYSERKQTLFEYPPVAKWRIGNSRFRYVAKPTFKTNPGPLFNHNASTVRADYNDDAETLYKVIQWTVEGKTAEEINELLGNEVIYK